MSADWTFPPVPPELKALSPFFQRAQELKVKDAVMAYWCTYYAAKQGISSKAQSKDARPFLYQVMTVLEEMKVGLGDNEAVTDDDAGAVYIENFALRVFTMADNEDRKGEATRSTAKKFLAAANFFELLHIFDKPVDADIEEKVRYSKWKAAELAKAFREGRKPTPGDAGAPPSEIDQTSPLSAATLQPPHDSAQSMSAWSPGTSVAPSPAANVMPSLTASPVSGTDVPLPPAASDTSEERMSPTALPKDAPSTPPRPFGGQLNLNHDHDGFTTPGMWSTMATPGTEDVYRVGENGAGIGESPSVRAAARRGMRPDMDGDADNQDDAWSTAGNQSMSRQGSWTVVDGAPLVPEGLLPPHPSVPPPSDQGLGLQPGVAPAKKVHFSPSVVGGLSSTSSSVAGSSPPGSPERFAPTLPTVQEAPYSSDSDREPAVRPRPDPATLPLPESGSSASEADGSPHGAPPVIQKVPSPTAPLSPNGFASPPVPPPHFPAPPQDHNFAAPPPQFPTAPPQAPGGLPPPPAPPAPRFAAPSVPPHANNHATNRASRAAPAPPPPPRSPSPPPELTSTQITRVQKHCRFAISALDYEDVHTARKELLAALAMLGG